MHFACDIRDRPHHRPDARVRIGPAPSGPRLSHPTCFLRPMPCVFPPVKDGQDCPVESHGAVALPIVLDDSSPNPKGAKQHD
jgi:hypothetical protein